MSRHDAPYPEPDRRQREAFASKHGLTGAWVRLGPSGQVHSVFRVGDRVVRIPRSHLHWIADTLTEAVAIPAVVACGVPTPRLVAFDDDRDVFDAPVVVTEHFAGAPVDPSSRPTELWRWLGTTLASMHEQVHDVPDPNGWLEAIEPEATRAELERASRAGRVDPDEARFVEGLLERVEGTGSRFVERVFVHNDVHVKNIMAGEDGFALIDWGDAGWGDATCDFMTLPPDWIVPVAAEYERHRPLPGAFGARVAWEQLGQALRRIHGEEARRQAGHARLAALRVQIEPLLSLGLPLDHVDPPRPPERP